MQCIDIENKLKQHSHGRSKWEVLAVSCGWSAAEWNDKKAVGGQWTELMKCHELPADYAPLYGVPHDPPHSLPSISCQAWSPRMVERGRPASQSS